MLDLPKDISVSLRLRNVNITSEGIIDILLLRQPNLPHRTRQIRRPLKHLQLPRLPNLLRPLLRNLHPRRTSPNNTAAFPSDVDAGVGPKGGVVDFSLERIETIPVREVAFRGKPETSDEMPRPEAPPSITGEVPQILTLLKCRSGDLVVEDGVFLDIEFLVDVFKVRSQLDMVRVMRGPVPIFVDFRKRQGVDGIL
jgi:hypothetical protein